MRIDVNKYYLILAYPDQYLSSEIKSFKDIDDNYHLFSELKETEKTIDYLVEIIYSNYFSKKRKCNAKTINILYKIIKNYNGKFSDKLKDKLFDLFKNIACESFSDNWKTYILINDLQLSELQIFWLLKNSENELVLNRILRYPFYNKQIASWCKEQLQNNNVLSDRYSEYISQTLEILDDFYNLFNQKKYKIETLAYSIKYSHFSKKDKESALIKLLCFDNKNLTVSKIAYELELYSILKKQM